MSTKAEEQEYRLDPIKWLFAIALVVGGTVAYTYYEEQFETIWRVLAVSVVIVVACFVAVTTAKGAAFWGLLRASQVEVRKVVWPTRQEVTQTTLIVLAVVLVTALILWGVDNLIGFFARLVMA